MQRDLDGCIIGNLVSIWNFQCVPSFNIYGWVERDTVNVNCPVPKTQCVHTVILVRANESKRLVLGVQCPKDLRIMVLPVWTGILILNIGPGLILFSLLSLRIILTLGYGICVAEYWKAASSLFAISWARTNNSFS